MFESGQKIGPYRLERSLGEGSYGVVWLAEERTGLIQRQVALKLPKEIDPDIEAVRREAAVWLSAGKHANVVQVLHADIYDGQVAIATEYIPGGSLHDRLNRQQGKTADLDHAVEIADGILAGLQHLHSLEPRPLIHRDLKPGNVLLRGDTPLLTDFGLSRVFSSTTVTQAGGTPGYMPPEAFDDKFSPQTDVWAAGVTLYRMVKGSLPFPQRDFAALIGAIFNKEPEPLPEGVPAALSDVIAKALMKDPDLRFHTAEEMRAALREARLHWRRGFSVLIPGSSSIPYDLGRENSPASDFPMTLTEQALVPDDPPRAAVAVLDKRHLVRPNSEALTAVPEPPVPPLPPLRERPLTQRADDLLRRLSRNTTTFCFSLLLALPIWAAFASFNRFLGHFRLEDSLPLSVFVLSGLMSVLFARLAWHRYYLKPEKERKKTAMLYALLGAFSGAAVPVMVVAFLIAITSATSASPETPEPEPAPRGMIEPPNSA
jgi:serine/threonine-protein kinase